MSRGNPTFWFPWEPIERYVQVTLRPWYERDLPGFDGDDGRHYYEPADGSLLTCRMIGDALGVRHSSVQRMRFTGRLTPRTADRYCCALGVHPAFIYGDLYWDWLRHEDNRRLAHIDRQRERTGALQCA